MQIQQKRKQKADEIKENKQFVQMITDNDEKLKLEDIQKQKEQKQKSIEL